jgi:hypothetical protein
MGIIAWNFQMKYGSSAVQQKANEKVNIFEITL